jgi:hypothetical protein
MGQLWRCHWRCHSWGSVLAMSWGLLRCCRQRTAFPILPHRHRSSSLPSAGFRARRAATNQGGYHAASLSTGGAPRQNDNYDEPIDPFQLVQPELTQLTGNIGDLIRTVRPQSADIRACDRRTPRSMHLTATAGSSATQAGDHPVLDAVAAYFFQDATRAKHFRPLVVLLIARATAAHRCAQSSCWGCRPCATGYLGTRACIAVTRYMCSNQPHDVANASQQRLAEISGLSQPAWLVASSTELTG